MENGPPALGLEDGAIDVECMLVEPQDEHLSMDSVMCFNKKIPENAADMGDVSRSPGVGSSVNSSLLSGGPDTGIAQEGKDIINGEVLNVMPSEVGYFQLDNDFSSMGEEYLLGVEFAESITNLDYGSSEGLQASVSESQIQVSSAGSDTTSKTDPYGTLDVPECQNDQYNVGSSDLSDIPSSHECGMLVVWNPFPPRSRSSFEDTLSDENDGRFSPAGDRLCSPKDGARNVSQGQEASPTVSVQAICSDVLPTQKRSRKPTQRYIDEFVDTSSTNFKKRREVSSTRKDKSRGVKDQKKCLMGPKSVKPPPEEFSVIAIQVPFGSLGKKECPDDGHAYDMVPYADSGCPVTKSKGKCVAPQNPNKIDKYGIGKKTDYAASQKKMEKRDDYATRQKKMENRDDYAARQKKMEKRDDYATRQKKMEKRDDYAAGQKKMEKRDDSQKKMEKRDDYAASQRKMENRDGYAASQKKMEKRDDYASRQKQMEIDDDYVTPAQSKKKDPHSTVSGQKKKNECTTMALIPKKKDDGDNCVQLKKNDECLTGERTMEVNGRRKHHRVWSISEVRKLIDGVAQYGVGRWSRIKKLFFSASPHRTSVDLKDKWRNLLKASGVLEQANQQGGEKKRNMAWRPLPKSILRRVCELASIYPYPKGQRHNKIAHYSPDKSADITLSDYRRILRSINDN